MRTTSACVIAFLLLASSADAQPYYRVSGQPIINPFVLPACNSDTQDVLFYSVADSTLLRCNGTWSVIGGGQSSAGPLCVSYLLWTPCSPTGTSNCTVSGAGCVAVANLTAVGQKGAIVALNADTFAHCRLRYSGALATAQIGTVTVALRSYTDSTDWISTAFNSGTTCADRSSSVTDVSAKTGLHYVGLRLGDSVTTDDPLLSGVTLTCCNQTFTW